MFYIFELRQTNQCYIFKKFIKLSNTIISFQIFYTLSSLKMYKVTAKKLKYNTIAIIFMDRSFLIIQILRISRGLI